MMGMGEKKTKYTKNEFEKPRKKFLVWLPSHSPVYEMEADCFLFKKKKKKKKAGPTLGRRGILAYWGKKYRVGRGMGS